MRVLIFLLLLALSLSFAKNCNFEISPTHTTCGNTNGKIDFTTTLDFSPISMSDIETFQIYVSNNNSAFSLQVNLNRFSGDSYSFQNRPSGDYKVRMFARARDSSGNTEECDQTKETTIQSSFAPALTSTGIKPKCFNGINGELHFSALPTGREYTFSINNSGFVYSSSPQIMPPGTYAVAVKDSITFCIANTTVTIAPNTDEIKATTVTSEQTKCQGEPTGSISISASNGVFPYEYSIDGAPFVSNGVFNSLVQGSYTYRVKDADSCIIEGIVIIAGPNDTVSGDIITTEMNCSSAASITFTGAGGSPPYSYSVNGGDFLNQNKFLLPAGNYTPVIMDSNLCLYNFPAVTISEPTMFTGPPSYIFSRENENYVNLGDFVSFRVTITLPDCESNDIRVVISTTENVDIISGEWIIPSSITDYSLPQIFQTDTLTAIISQISNPPDNIRDDNDKIIIVLTAKISEQNNEIVNTMSATAEFSYRGNDGIVTETKQIPIIVGTANLIFSLENTNQTDGDAGDEVFFQVKVSHAENSTGHAYNLTVSPYNTFPYFFLSHYSILETDPAAITTHLPNSFHLSKLSMGSKIEILYQLTLQNSVIASTSPQWDLVLNYLSPQSSVLTLTPTSKILPEPSSQLLLHNSLQTLNAGDNTTFHIIITIPEGVTNNIILQINFSASNVLSLQGVYSTTPLIFTNNSDNNAFINITSVVNSPNNNTDNNLDIYLNYTTLPSSQPSTQVILTSQMSHEGTTIITEPPRSASVIIITPIPIICPIGYYLNGSNCEAFCGDKYCNASIGENCVSCPYDCKDSVCDTCGDGLCNSTIGETCSTCYEDCRSTCIVCPACSTHGVCVNGRCSCNEGWSGPTCEVIKEPIIVVSNTTQPSVTITSPSSNIANFEVFIKRLVEKNQNREEVDSVILDSSLNFTYVDSGSQNNSVFLYSATLTNKAVINITFIHFKEASSHVVLNETTQFSANTFKFNLLVERWPFSAITNSLDIEIENNINFGSDPCVTNDAPQGHLQWWRVSSSGATLYAEFDPTAFVDGRKRTIQFSTSSSSSSIIIATLPHFWTNAEMDPNYSVLLYDEQEGDECREEEQNNNKEDKGVHIAAIVVPVVVVGVAALIALGVFAYPRLRTRMQLRKARQVDEAELTGVSTTRI